MAADARALPRRMRDAAGGLMNLFRCTRCLYPNTKPDIWFGAQGLCSACQAFDKRATVDWELKEREFVELVRANRGKTHDCIVACSGGKDSSWQIIKCLELGLQPLAVTASTDHLSEVGRRNLDNISNLCDHIVVTPNRAIRRRISKFALMEVGDISWCEHHLIWSIPAREAAQRDIPIVLYGECPQNEYGAGPRGSESADRLTDGWVHEFGGLLGLRIDDGKDILGLREGDVDIYRRPAGGMALFMGAYFPWDGHQNAAVAARNGFEPYPGLIEGSLCGYENCDNLQTGIHDRLRWLKFGYSRACDIACNHIRRGRMKRDEAARTVWLTEQQPFNSYLGVPLRDILTHINVSETEWQSVIDRFTNHEVVNWASRAESFQPCSGAPMAVSKASDGTSPDVSALLQIESGSWSAAT